MTAIRGSAICPHPRATERLCCLRKRQENETNMLDNVSWDTLYINNSKKNYQPINLLYTLKSREGYN